MSIETERHSKQELLVPNDAVLILFGASGDLAKRKLLPGLFHLAVAGLMPKSYRIIGTCPPGTGVDPENFSSYVHDLLERFGRKEVTDEAWEAFSPSLSFAPSTSDEMAQLKQEVEKAESELQSPSRIVYLAVPPDAFVPMISALSKTGLAKTARLIIEKPFGSDLDSARDLNQAIHKAVEESQIFRIDHFLGKEAIQNILVFRFANGLFEPAWNREHIDYVQIDVPEQLTIEGRASFYESTGAFRDMVVTHVFQLLGFLAMDPPDSLDADAIHGKKLEVFNEMVPLDPSRVVLGQYEGYRSEPGVASDSTVETFVAAEVMIDNERWAGVPFQVRTGKALAESRITVTLGFKVPPLKMLDLEPGDSNELVFELSEPGEINIHFLTKDPGPQLSIGPSQISFRYADSLAAARELEAYERLLHDVMLDDHVLFNRADGIERLWEVAGPVLENRPVAMPYPIGSWGPPHIRELVAPFSWHLPDRTRANETGNSAAIHD